MKELWVDVKGFEGKYQISNTGRVKSLHRLVKNGVGYRKVRGRLLKPGIGTKGKVGYHFVILSVKQKHTIKYIHRLVALAFIKKSSKLTVNHKDGNTLNNHISNLELVTIQENIRHCNYVLNRNGMKGKKHTEEAIKKIRIARAKQIMK